MKKLYKIRATKLKFVNRQTKGLRKDLVTWLYKEDATKINRVFCGFLCSCRAFIKKNISIIVAYLSLIVQIGLHGRGGIMSKGQRAKQLILFSSMHSSLEYIYLADYKNWLVWSKNDVGLFTLDSILTLDCFIVYVIIYYVELVNLKSAEIILLATLRASIELATGLILRIRLIWHFTHFIKNLDMDMRWVH